MAILCIPKKIGSTFGVTIVATAGPFTELTPVMPTLVAANEFATHAHVGNVFIVIFHKCSAQYFEALVAIVAIALISGRGFFLGGTLWNSDSIVGTDGGCSAFRTSLLVTLQGRFTVETRSGSRGLNSAIIAIFFVLDGTVLHQLPETRSFFLNTRCRVLGLCANGVH
jgi:hypothetical protein